MIVSLLKDRTYVKDDLDRKRIRIKGISFKKIFMYNNSIDVIITGRAPNESS